LSEGTAEAEKSARDGDVGVEVGDGAIEGLGVLLDPLG
jgi:hypothetical protein